MNSGATQMECVWLLMASERENPHACQKVIFLELPPGLVDGLPEEDQRARSLVGYDEDGRAELFFDDPFTGDSMESILRRGWI